MDPIPFLGSKMGLKWYASLFLNGMPHFSKITKTNLLGSWKRCISEKTDVEIRGILFGFYSDILWNLSSLSGDQSGILSDIYSDILSGILSDTCAGPSALPFGVRARAHSTILGWRFGVWVQAIWCSALAHSMAEDGGGSGRGRRRWRWRRWGRWRGRWARRVSKELHLWLKSRDPRLAGGEQTQATCYKQFL